MFMDRDFHHNLFYTLWFLTSSNCFSKRRLNVPLLTWKVVKANATSTISKLLLSPLEMQLIPFSDFPNDLRHLFSHLLAVT